MSEGFGISEFLKNFKRTSENFGGENLKIFKKNFNFFGGRRFLKTLGIANLL